MPHQCYDPVEDVADDPAEMPTGGDDESEEREQVTDRRVVRRIVVTSMSLLALDLSLAGLTIASQVT